MVDKFLQFLGLMKRAGKLCEGYNRCEEFVLKNKVFLLIISEDVSQNTKEKFLKYCEKQSVPIIEGYTKEELGKTLGRHEINIIGVLDQNVSERLSNLFSEKNDT